MSLTLSPWEWLSLAGGVGLALITLLFGAGRLLLGQFERRLDLRFATLEATRQQAAEQWRANFLSLDEAVRAHERRLTQLLIDLPIQYQRREDAIRQEVAIIHRLDALAIKIEHILTCDTRACPLRETHSPGVS